MADSPVVDGVESAERLTNRSQRKWILLCTSAALLVLGLVWFWLASDGSASSVETVSGTVADCTHSMTEGQSGSAPNPVPIVVGVGSVNSIAAFYSSLGVRWCFVGPGIGVGNVPHSALRKPVDVVAAVLDGNSNHWVLLLVHHTPHTQVVVVNTRWSRSAVVARAGGFEVLRVSVARWPNWHVPWNRPPVTLGEIVGYDKIGQVTARQPFSWCQGAVNSYPNTVPMTC